MINENHAKEYYGEKRKWKKVSLKN
jgi:hypothetical protein